MDDPNSDLNAQALEEAATDALMARIMPDAYDAMIKARLARASIPAPPPAPQPTVAVALISPDAMKRPEAREGALASLASLAFAAAVTGFQNGLAAKTPALADAYLSQAARQSLTVTALIDSLTRAQSKPPKQPSIRSSRETWNAYHRDLMRKRSALAKAGEAQRLDA